jgi:hypothetical protein
MVVGSLKALLDMLQCRVETADPSASYVTKWFWVSESWHVMPKPAEPVWAPTSSRVLSGTKS